MPAEVWEKRRYPRIRSENPVLVTKLNPADLVGFAKLEDLGLGGCTFRHKEFFGAGTPVEVVISGGDRLVKAYGHVVRERRIPGEGVEVAVQFSDISPAGLEAMAGLFETEG